MLHTATKAPATKPQTLSREGLTALHDLDKVLLDESKSAVSQCRVAHAQIARLLRPKPQAADFQRLGKALEFVDGLHPDCPLKKAKDDALAALAAAGVSLASQAMLQHNNGKLFWLIEAGQANDLGLKFVKDAAGVYLVFDATDELNKLPLFEVRKDNSFVLHSDSNEAFEKCMQLCLKGIKAGEKLQVELTGFSPEAEKRFLAITTKLAKEAGVAFSFKGEHVSSHEPASKQVQIEGVAPKTLETAAPTPAPSPSGVHATDEDDEKAITSSAPTLRPPGSVGG